MPSLEFSREMSWVSPVLRTVGSIPFHFPTLVIVLAIDALLVGFNIYVAFYWEHTPDIFNIARDRSIEEIFGYALVAGSVALLFRIYRLTRLPMVLSFIAILVIAEIDDSAGVHELVGAYSLAHGVVSDQNSGELIVWLAYCVILLPTLAFGMIKTPVHRLVEGLGLLLGIGLLFFFAVGIDFINHDVCENFSLWGYCMQLMDFTEDGGELFAQSLIFAHVVGWSRYIRNRAAKDNGGNYRAEGA